MRWHRRERDGVRLWCADYGGAGMPVVLLHGLAGYAGEWAGTASWLRNTNRVVAVEQRGHGRSERTPGDMSRAAFVGDVEMWIEQLGLAPAVLVGQSLGGHTAFLVSTARPDLVAGLVVVEATPQVDPGAPDAVRSWLDAWPVPFASRADAVAFFGGEPAWGKAWADGLEQRADGFWPSFEASVMLSALNETSRTSYWSEWAAIRCPTLIVRSAGREGREDYRRMAAMLPGARLVEVERAGHDLHLDQPERWHETLGMFLRQKGSDPVWRG